MPDGQTRLIGRSDGNLLFSGRVPVLGDIPVLGGLYTARSGSDTTSSLLVTVTPFLQTDVFDDF